MTRTPTSLLELNRFVTKGELAESYGISPQTLTKKLDDIPIDLWQDEKGIVPIPSRRQAISPRQLKVIVQLFG